MNKANGPFLNGFLSLELVNSKHIMYRGIIVVENPFVRQEFESFRLNRFLYPCQHFQITPFFV
jgi:hypothetical protein